MPRNKTISDFDLLHKATSVILEKGPESFTLRQISEATGLCPAALLKRFRSKERLARKALEQRYLAHLQEEKNPSPPNPGLSSLKDHVEELCRHYDAESIAQHLRLLAEDLTQEDLRQTASSLFAKNREKLCRLIEASQKNGELKSDVRAESLAELLEAIIQGASVQWAFLPERPSLQTWIMRAMGLALRPWLIKQG
ncbi:MAG: TetR/AcrR family transcriptional regulator [Bdellovibrionaceae bacterium]|nr:TetR/AcrR family transcriptional regulator [Pseudobdellovibrionaceae bacterium]